MTWPAHRGSGDDRNGPGGRDDRRDGRKGVSGR